MQSNSAERGRRQALVNAHFAVENRHDVDGIMRTFSAEAEMIYNRESFADPDSIRQAHGYIGFATPEGAFTGLRTVTDREHLTDDEIVIEGRLCGRHVGEFQGFPPSGRDVELPYVAFYHFDRDGKLTSERVVMNLGPLLTRA